MAFGVRLPALARTAPGFGLWAPAGNRLPLLAPRPRRSKIAGSGARALVEDNGCGRDASTANEHRLQRCSFFAQQDNSSSGDGNSSPVVEKKSQSLFVL